VLEFLKKPALRHAWAAVALWVLTYGALKLSSLDGLDIDSAEQVYFAQSWQMGYGTRQPPLYTWLILLLKPAQASWVATLEVSRYLCLLIWLAGVQALARACGGDRSVQARVVLAHLGLMLAMWRVHDSLTHTVLAAGITVWASVALIKALTRPAYWLLVGGLAALACLSKLNAALWCASSFLSAWAMILWRPAQLAPAPAVPVLRHLRWMLAAVAVFILLMAPYAHWWLTQPTGSVSLAERIVLSDAKATIWQPLLRLLLGALEYLLVAPLLVFVLAWRLRRHLASRPAVSEGSRWLVWQTACGLLILMAVLMAMKASHFTPRWLWPVIPGFTVWMCVSAFQTLDALQGPQAVWRTRASALVWLLAGVAIAVAGLRLIVPERNAQRCTNCWTDRPAEQMSRTLHRRHGEQPLRIITGDDHLAGVLAQVSERDSTWAANSLDLPPPADFVRASSPCVVAWVSMDKPLPLPSGLARLVGAHDPAAVVSEAWPLRLAPARLIWLQSMALPNGVCDQARP